MILSDLTLEQLRNATKDQIISKIVEKLTPLTKRRLVEFVWGIRGVATDGLTLSDLVQSKDSPNGQVLRINKTTDILANKLSSQKVEWTYYPTGEVDTITMSELNALDQVISQKKIKHFTGGRQPIILT